jgi:predicted N-acyltransferase
MPTLGVHSWHLLFPDEADQQLLDQPGSLHRLGCQFHWYNRNYRDFDDFLTTLTSRKRKSLRRERRQVAEQGIRFRHWPGDSLPDEVLDDFFLFYNATYLKRGMRPYLNRDFFSTLAQRLGAKLRIITAEQAGKRIAAALFIIGDQTLYGRYWGCLEDYNHLHFETCYYQGIDLAIAEGLARFDAGAQGEHKLVRGFEPVLTHSWHNVDHPGFREAIADFCEEEALDVEGYHDAALAALPYRQESEG